MQMALLENKNQGKLDKYLRGLHGNLNYKSNTSVKFTLMITPNQFHLKDDD